MSRQTFRISARTHALCLSVVAVLGGCAAGGMTPTQTGTAQGAGLGALGGAALGALIDGSRGARTGAALGAVAGGTGGYVWSKKMEDQKKAMEAATRGTGVAVVQTPDNQLKLEVPSDISFSVGRADIAPSFRSLLDQFAGSLNSNPGTSIRIIGHTDSTGSDAVNNPLSVNRASSVRDYLTARGVAAQRIAIDGRVSREPLVDNATEQNRARNRRVEIFVAETAPAG